jgi:tetratricopeptide (TPR) repeat protein
MNIMKLQHYMVETLTGFNPRVNRLPKGRANDCLKVLISILLFPSLSLMLTQPLKAASPLSVQANPVSLNNQIQDTVQAELDQAYRRKFATLNLLLIVLLLLPTASAVIAWFFLSKLGQKMAIAHQEIESLQADTISQLESLIEETKTALHHLLEKNTLAEETLKQLNVQPQIAPNMHSNSIALPPEHLAKDYARQGEKGFVEGDYETAINAYNKALKIQPSLAEVWNNRGVILTKLKRYSEAINSYEQALKIRSNYPDAWNNQGVVLGKIKSYEMAVESYNQAVKLKPDYGDAWNNRGFALTKLKKYDEAIQSYQKAAELKPNFHLIWYNQARCYGLQGKADLAIETLKKAIQIKPEVSRKLAQKESDFESLRSNPEFKELVTG